MRIFYFPKIITKEETQKCSLRNCPVVMDGNNFLYHMYENSKIPFIFGCETDKYDKYLKSRFEMFKQANVKCFFIFKGGDTDIEKKIKKFQHLFFNFNTHCEFVPPVLLKDANAQVIDKLGIDNAFCVTESKDECVALAQKLKCPVISFDIDYCFRKAPYIPSITMKFNKRTNSIECRQYKLQDFLQKHSLTEEKMAIFATLTDSTVFPLEFFDSLLQTWRVPSSVQIIKLKKLIEWLSKHSEEQAREGISEALSNDDDRNKFWLHYQKILTNMQKNETGLVTDYLINSKISIVKQDPEWFEKGVVCKHVSHKYVNLYKSRIIEGSWVTEDRNSRDSILLSIDIVKYAYNLLTNYRRDTIKLYQDANSYVEIDTHDPNVRKPQYNCNISVFENGWDQIKHLKLFEHFLSENKIDTKVLAELPADAAVLFIALVYFARKKELEGEDVTREVYAVVLSYVMLNYVFNRNGSLDFKDCAQAKLATVKYYKYDEVEARRIFDGEALKRLVEFQYCIVYMNYLNTLCGSPYKTTQYSRCYNGTFIFKMFCDMRERDVDDFVNKLFQSAPSVLAVVKVLVQVYRELLTRANEYYALLF